MPHILYFKSCTEASEPLLPCRCTHFGLPRSLRLWKTSATRFTTAYLRRFYLLTWHENCGKMLSAATWPTSYGGACLRVDNAGTRSPANAICIIAMQRFIQCTEAQACSRMARKESVHWITSLYCQSLTNISSTRRSITLLLWSLGVQYTEFGMACSLPKAAQQESCTRSLTPSSPRLDQRPCPSRAVWSHHFWA